MVANIFGTAQSYYRPIKKKKKKTYVSRMIHVSSIGKRLAYDK